MTNSGGRAAGHRKSGTAAGATLQNAVEAAVDTAEEVPAAVAGAA